SRPRSVVMLRTASAIFTSASLTTPAAAAERVRPSGAPIFSSIARTAPARSSGLVPPRNRAASIRPRTRLAAVTVGSPAPRARGRVWPERRGAARVAPRDRPPAGAHFLDVDHRNPQRAAIDVVLVRGLHEPALDDRALRGRATHVERDQAIGAEHPREARAAGD